MTVRIITGDCREVLRSLPDESVHCCVTSPPYWGLRDYGVDGQIGLEREFGAYVEQLVAVFREVRRVLRKDGTLWLNLGDSYATGGGSIGRAQNSGGGPQGERFIRAGMIATQPNRMPQAGLKPKDLVGIPWRVAFALQADGWWLRQDIVWSKPNPMPESVTDRCTKAHEYLFLLSKSERYYFDQEAILEPISESTHLRVSQATLAEQEGFYRVPGKTNGTMKAVVRDVGIGSNARPRKAVPNGAGLIKNNLSFDAAMVAPGRRSGNKERKDATERGCPRDGVDGSIPWEGYQRNRRSVWTVTMQPFSEAHFATFPPALIEPCILAGSQPGGVVLDPFGGAGTTGLVADRMGRDAILIELNPKYADMVRRRITRDAPLLAEVAAQ